MTESSREHDIILFGATGFTGRLVAEYWAGRSEAAPGVRIALAGRSAEKLEVLREQLGPSAQGWPIVVADSSDRRAMTELAECTRVVCTTVGPYALYGSELVAACAERGTDYCDLTGEVQWMRRMIDMHESTARESGARIVHCCGFDCIPSDLGVHFVQREMKLRHGVAAPRIKLRVEGFSGGASGGTIASMLNMLEEAGRDPAVRRLVANPYALCPEGEQDGPDGPDPMTPGWDSDFGQWTAPFVMAAINTRVVRRSNLLLDYAYGRDFRYEEAMLMGAGPGGMAKAAATSAALAGGTGLAAIGPLRRSLAGRLPKPGEGPSREQRERGHWELLFHASHPEKESESMRARVTGDRDPGYGSTSKMLGESALCLARDPLPERSGFLTPASAMGDALCERLEASAGVRFALVDPAPGK